MSNDTKERKVLQIFTEQVFPTILVSVIVGIGSSYLTAKQTITEMDQKMSEIQRRLDRQREVDKELLEGRERVREQLTSIETKVDLLMKDKGLVSQ